MAVCCLQLAECKKDGNVLKRRPFRDLEISIEPRGSEQNVGRPIMVGGDLFQMVRMKSL